jgi:hypothetical protein
VIVWFVDIGGICVFVPNNHLSSQIIEQAQKYHQYQQTKQSPLISNH